MLGCLEPYSLFISHLLFEDLSAIETERSTWCCFNSNLAPVFVEGYSKYLYQKSTLSYKGMVSSRHEFNLRYEDFYHL